MADRSEVAEIRQQMRSIREGLPVHLIDARYELKQNLSLKHHASKHPMLIFGAMAVIGFLLVPKRSPKPEPKAVHWSDHLPFRSHKQQREETQEAVAKASLLSMALSTVTTFAVRAGTTYLARRFMSSWHDRIPGMKRESAGFPPASVGRTDDVHFTN